MSGTEPGLPEYSQRRPIVAGIGIWALLLVAGLLFRDTLVEAGHGWWIWTAVAGIVLGGLGLSFVSTRRHRSGPDGQRG